MIPFLKSVAKAYAEMIPGRLADMKFIFPNKRSCTFFTKYLAESLPSGQVFIAPDVTTVEEFVEKLSGNVVDSHIDLLFTLYSTYIDMLRERGAGYKDFSEEQLPDFDSFLRWGEAVLQDFNDVDIFCVDHSVFKNVRDYREIASNFLSEDQIRVMQEYFNYTPDISSAETFWKKMPSQTDPHAPSSRFFFLWQQLAPLFDRFEEKLKSRGLTTQGGAYRQALDRIKKEGIAPIDCKKIVFVGFNALSTAEYHIFRLLSKERCTPDMEIGDCDAFADFFWDATGPVLKPGEKNSASKFVDFNIREFPAPAWAMPYLRLSDTDSLPESMVQIASPSNTIQAKLAADVVEKLLATKEVKDFSSVNVAVVLPDESLLFPFLYAMPEDCDVNLTMGYPLRQTSTMSFVALLKRLLLHRRTDTHGKIQFNCADVKAFFAHPFSQTVAGSDCAGNIADKLSSLRSSSAALEEIAAISPNLASLLGIVSSPTQHSLRSSAQSVLGLLLKMEKIMEHVKVAVAGSKSVSEMVKSSLDIAHIDIYCDALRRLRDAVEETQVAMTEATALYLADRLLGAEKVQFEGEPLRGLQVIGMLETRSLDFEYLIIPSLNERIFPRKSRSRTFIPDSLRRGYGMPPSNYQESLFAYYFYRMISRARKVWLIYDSRTSSGGRSGEPSRYLSQLNYLYAVGSVRHKDYSFVIDDACKPVKDIQKTDDVMNMLDSFRRISDAPSGKDQAPGRKNISASALDRYNACQAKFFYEFVVGLKDSEDISENIDAISQGNILHSAMERIYPKATPGSPKRITPEFLSSLLNPDSSLINHEVDLAVARQHYHIDDECEAQRRIALFPGGVRMVARGIADNVRQIVAHDFRLAPFDLLGCEIKETLAFPIVDSDGNEFKVNMKFAIDRLDRVSLPGTPEPVLRIVDYKTGAIHLEAERPDMIFTDPGISKNIFQLLLYGHLLGLYHQTHPINGVDPGEIPDPVLEIYPVMKIKERSTPFLPKVAKKELRHFSELAEDFKHGIDALMSEIFDKDKPFRHTNDTKECTRCHLRSLCGR